MSAFTAAVKGRRAAEALMTDACTITRQSLADPVLNTTTGELVDEPSVLYTGKCRVKPVPSNRTGGELVGETVVARQAAIISIPYAEGDMNEGDRIEVTDSPDTQLAGQHFLIKSIQVGTHATARRFICDTLS